MSCVCVSTGVRKWAYVTKLISLPYKVNIFLKGTSIFAATYYETHVHVELQEILGLKTALCVSCSSKIQKTVLLETNPCPPVPSSLYVW